MRSIVIVLTVLAGCDPGVCGHVFLSGVAMNPEIEKYRGTDGRIALAERCTTDYGAFALERTDLGMTTITLDASDPGGGDGDEILRDVLPAASVVFWDAHLVKGNTIPIQQLAGSGVHQSSADSPLQIYLLTAGTITVLDGPNNREVTTFDGDMHFTEEWKLRWSLDYGTAQHWDGEDTVTRSDGSTAGTPAHYPPDPKP